MNLLHQGAPRMGACSTGMLRSSERWTASSAHCTDFVAIYGRHGYLSSATSCIRKFALSSDFAYAATRGVHSSSRSMGYGEMEKVSREVSECCPITL